MEPRKLAGLCGRPGGHRETHRGAGSFLAIRLPLFTSCVVLAGGFHLLSLGFLVCKRQVVNHFLLHRWL